MRKRTTLVSMALAGATIFVLSVVATEAGGQDTGSAGPAQAAELTPEMAAKMAAALNSKKKPGDLPKFKDVAKDYKKVVSTADGQKSLYTIWTREKDGQMLAELPRSFKSQKLFIAYTIAGGTRTAGVQMGDRYAYWKRFDKTLALIEPNYEVRTTGDAESKKGRDRVFTDRVILSVPIAAMGPGGGPVIDMDALLVGQSGKFFGWATRGANTGLARIAKAKAFPKNVELAFTLPLASGRFGTLHYSFNVLPENTGYKSRTADTRIGFFTTTHMDVGHPGADTPWIRFVNRWKLEKADSKLRMSPPKEPIVFYLEHTLPVRYRRWVRDGVLEWNRAFEKVGIVGAIEVYQQDARTKAHMEKDPEDARYNFVLWTNANMGFAIGPSRVDPRTGQILDADIVMDEGFITSWVNAWKKVIPEAAIQNFGPDTFAWLRTRPQWDPRVRLAAPAERPRLVQDIARRGHVGPEAAFAADPTLLGDERYDGLSGRVSQVNGYCDYASAASLELALLRLDPALLFEVAQMATSQDDDGDEEDGDAKDQDGNVEDEEKDKDEGDKNDEEKSGEKKDDVQLLDGVPESFIGPMLKNIVMHEVGHTLGLRHNFKASSTWGLDEINSEDLRGRAITGSVMDYNPININVGDGEVQGEYTMVTIGPYDYWAIEYGYTFENDLKPIVSRVSEPELAYGTDEDTWGPDPLARRFDMGRDPLAYAESQMRLVQDLRGKILERMVKDGDSWAKAREGYELLLGRHFSMVSIAANWVGGTHEHRDRKGDPGGRDPIEPVSVEQQRRALRFVITNAFRDEAFGLTPELLAKMGIDKWWDAGGFSQLFQEPAWPVHDRILAIRAAALTMLMNPTTLNRVYDNEFRVPEDEDALTLPEIIWDLTDEIWSELGKADMEKHTARRPMISSLRRDLQREHLERLIDLTFPNPALGVAAKPLANLSTHKLRELGSKIDRLIDRRRSRLDPYSLAHLSEAQVRIEKALDAQYIYNTDDINGGGGFPFFFFGEDGSPSPRR